MGSVRPALLAFQAWPLFAVFLVSGSLKLRNPSATATALRAYGLAGRQSSLPIAVGLGLGEVVLAVGVLSLPPTLAALIALAVLTIFTGFLVFNLVRGVRMDCGCFGKGLPSVISWWTVARNLVVAVPVGLLAAAPAGWAHFMTRASAMPLFIIGSLEASALFLVVADLSLSSISTSETLETARV